MELEDLELRLHDSHHDSLSNKMLGSWKQVTKKQQKVAYWTWRKTPGMKIGRCEISSTRWFGESFFSSDSAGWKTTRVCGPRLPTYLSSQHFSTRDSCNIMRLYFCFETETSPLLNKMLAQHYPNRFIIIFTSSLLLRTAPLLPPLAGNAILYSLCTCHRLPFTDRIVLGFDGFWAIFTIAFFHTERGIRCHL